MCDVSLPLLVGRRRAGANQHPVTADYGWYSAPRKPLFALVQDAGNSYYACFDSTLLSVTPATDVVGALHDFSTTISMDPDCNGS